MSAFNSETEDDTTYQVVMNHEEQYSIWPAHKSPPPGWTGVGKTGAKAECLAYVEEVWVDMRPLSLRKKMEERAKNPPPMTDFGEPDWAKKESLVDRLCRGNHRVEAKLRPGKSIELFKEAVDRGYVQIQFTDTNGGTELRVKLDKEACDFAQADFAGGVGMAHLVGSLTLDYVKVRCIADIDLKALEGKGRLEKAQAEA
jgi:uncharacterized protein YbdZ (MbtH family)